MILAGDIGGTHTRLLLAQRDGARWVPVRQQVFASQAFASLDEVLAQFLAPGETVQAACLGVAGPVIEGRCDITHLPWQLDAAALAASAGIPAVELLNDFVVQAYGLPALAPDEILTLQAGEPQAGGPRLLVGAGTGLGIATLVACGEGLHVLASEGGHASFAPQGARQLALARFLFEQYGPPSVELALSGRGIENVYRFVLHEHGVSRITPLAAPAVSAAAAAGDALAQDALGLFCEIFGAVAGDLALINLPTGGVYLTGGIAAKLADTLASGRLLAAFRDKRLKRDLVARIPLHVVRNEQLGLLGAAERAAQLAGRAG